MQKILQDIQSRYNFDLSLIFVVSTTSKKKTVLLFA